MDYHFDRVLTENEITEIQKRVNDIIKSNLDIREEFYPKEEAEKKFNLSKLPEGAGDNIRIIHIGDYDSCPCIGNHVKNTNEIGEFKIISTNYENSVLRIRYKLNDK